MHCTQHLMLILCSIFCWLAVDVQADSEPFFKQQLFAVLPSAVLMPEAAIVNWGPIEEKLRAVLLENGCLVVSADSVRNAFKQRRIFLPINPCQEEIKAVSEILQCNCLLRCTLEDLLIRQQSEEKEEYLGTVKGMVKIYIVKEKISVITIPFSTELLSMDRSVFPNGLKANTPALAQRLFYEELLEVAFSRQVWPKIRTLK